MTTTTADVLATLSRTTLRAEHYRNALTAILAALNAAQRNPDTSEAFAQLSDAILDAMGPLCGPTA